MKWIWTILLWVVPVAFQPGLAAAPAAGGSEPRTLILSDRLELVTSESANRFLFEGNVRVEGNNLEATCDRMEVLANRKAGSEPEATFGEIGSIESILATGRVRITQGGRRAEAGRAEIFPREGKVILTENPKVIDEKGMEATGTRMILLQGERKAVIEGAPEGGTKGRPRVVLPSIPDLGYPDGADADPAVQPPSRPDEGVPAGAGPGEASDGAGGAEAAAGPGSEETPPAPPGEVP